MGKFRLPWAVLAVAVLVAGEVGAQEKVAPSRPRHTVDVPSLEELNRPLPVRTEAEVPGLDSAPVLRGEPPAVNDSPVSVPAEAEPDRVAPLDGETGAFRYRSSTWFADFRALNAGGVQVLEAFGGVVEFAPVEAPAISPEVDESGLRVVYREVWPGVDLRYDLSPAGVEETLVVAADPGRSSFDFAVTDGQVRANGDGTHAVLVNGEPSRLEIGVATVTDFAGRTMEAAEAAVDLVEPPVSEAQRSAGLDPAMFDSLIR